MLIIFNDNGDCIGDCVSGPEVLYLCYFIKLYKNSPRFTFDIVEYTGEKQCL